MERTVLILSILFICLAISPNPVQSGLQFSNSYRFRTYTHLPTTGHDNQGAPKSSLKHNVLLAERTSESDAEERESTALFRENEVASQSDNTSSNDSPNRGVDNNPVTVEDAKEEKAPADEPTTTSNHSNDPPIASSLLKTAYIYISKPGLGSPLTQPVFKENGLVGLFNSCSKFGIHENIGPIGADTCFQDDEYNDRITFEMTFRESRNLIENAFHHQPPNLLTQADTDQIAEPRIFFTDVSMATSAAKVVVLYDCKPGLSGSIYLSLQLSFGDSRLVIPWTKTCSSGENEKISFGYIIENGSKSSKINFNKSESSALVVTPSDVSTEVYLKLQQPGAQQLFLAPYVTSSKPEITEVLVRGNHLSGGVLNGLEENLFQLSYTCEQKGLTEIRVTIAFPPFDNVTASWTKDCGGQTPSNLQVGTTAGSSDVIKNGEPTHSFMVGIQHIGKEHSDEHMHLSGNESNWKVFLHNNILDMQSAEATLYIGRITLTVEHPENVVVPEPRLRSNGALGWSVESNAGFALQPEKYLKVSFHFVCRRIGESRILITLPILHYDTVEFGIAKRCTHVGRVRKSAQLVFTAGKALVLLIAFCVAIVVITIIRRGSGRKGFKALPTIDK